MNKIFCILTFLLVNFFTIDTEGAEIWKESFSVAEKGFWGDANGSTVHSDMTGISKWSLNVSACRLIAANDYVKTVATSGGRLEAMDCKGEAIWASEWVNIEQYKDASLNLTTSETGTGTNIANKYIKVYYQVDSQPETLCESNGYVAGNFTQAIVSQSKLNGTKLRVVIRMSISYASDKLIVDEIVIEGEPKIVKKASSVRINQCPATIFLNQLFEIKAQAICSDGSVDPQYNQALYLVAPNGNLNVEQVAQTPIDGIYHWKNVSIKEIGICSIQVSNLEISSTLHAIEVEKYDHPSFLFEFEDQQLGDWTPADDWEVSNQSKINGSYSLKHSDKASTTESCLYYPVNRKLSASDYRWSLILKNGDWDPSSSNRF